MYLPRRHLDSMLIASLPSRVAESKKILDSEETLPLSQRELNSEKVKEEAEKRCVSPSREGPEGIVPTVVPSAEREHAPNDRQLALGLSEAGASTAAVRCSVATRAHHTLQAPDLAETDWQTLETDH
jgi:hypothetical protein